MTLSFTKMHALGNDFVILNAIQHPVNLSTQAITTLSNRQLGIGFDQLLIIETSKKADFFCRIINTDGSEAEQCGNGLRCIARYLHEEGIHPNTSVTIATKTGVFPITITDYDHIRVAMNTPLIQEALVELALPTSIISMGNPHAVIRVASLDNTDRANIAATIAKDPHFPHGVNVGFMQLVDRHSAKLRTVERGAGETLACGSNACAAAAAGIVNGWLNSPVTIAFQYGKLIVDWEGEGQPLYLTGPASRVFSGIY